MAIANWIGGAERHAPGWLRRTLRRPRALRHLARSRRGRATWATEYEAGVWDRLHGVEELGRFSIVAGYIRHIGGTPRVLDIGCGSGVLADHLGHLPHVYVGCDYASPAIRRAVQRTGSGARFLVADAAHPPFQLGSFDVVVCSELLYYIEDSPEAITAITRLLAPNGHLIVSMFDAFGRPQRAYWNLLGRQCVLVDMVAVTSGSAKQTWRIALLRPRSNQPA